MKKQFVVRLDDASPTMHLERWNAVFEILCNHGVMPLVGVIPNNKDKSLVYGNNPHFWPLMREWEHKGATMALHGYDHCYISRSRGMNPLWPRSEFAGVAKEVQRDKIARGYAILKENGLHPKAFFAPSHTFDKKTIECLVEYTDIRVVSDTMAFAPYKMGEVYFVPVLSGHFIDVPVPGVWTFCFHPDLMTDKSIDGFDRFIATHRHDFCSWCDVELRDRSLSFADRLLQRLYYLRRTVGGYDKDGVEVVVPNE